LEEQTAKVIYRQLSVWKSKHIRNKVSRSKRAPTQFSCDVVNCDTGVTMCDDTTCPCHRQSIFGQTATTQAGGLFGSTPTSTAFGTPGFGTPSVFGATTQAVRVSSHRGGI